MTTEFTFSALARRDANVCARVRGATERIRALWGAANRNLIKIGAELIEVKAELAHGEWAGWLEREFAMDERTAQRLMTLGRRFGRAKSEELQLEGFSATALYELAAPSTPDEVVEEVAREAKAGKAPTRPSIQKKKRALAEPEPDEKVVSQPPAVPVGSGELHLPDPDRIEGVRRERERIKGLERDLVQLRGKVQNLRAEYEDEVDGMALAGAGLAAVEDVIRQAVSLVRQQVLPVGFCPHCKGHGCTRCAGGGWATESFVGEAGGEVWRWR